MPAKPKAGGAHRPDPLRPKRRAGFTLLEFLVCLAIFAMIMAVLTQGSRAILGNWLRAGQQTGDEQQVWSAFRLMHRQVLSAVPYQVAGNRSRAVAFAGAANEVTFVTTQSLFRRGSVGLWFVRYTVETDKEAGGYQLVLRQWSAFGAVGGAAGEEVVLLGGLESASFAYQALDPLRKTTAFVAQWPYAAAGRLPRVLRLSLEREGRELQWQWRLECGDG